MRNLAVCCSFLAAVIGCSLGGDPRPAAPDGGGSGGGGNGGGDNGGGDSGGDNGGSFDPSAFVPYREPPAPHAGWTPGAPTCAPLANSHGLASTLFCAPAGMAQPDPAHPSPLVVVLPGYTMTIEDYQVPSEWEHVGAAHGFYVLYVQVENGIAIPTQGIPEGPRAWYFYDSRRARGQADAANVAGLVESLIASGDYGIHPDHVYVTGISAGGYMAVVLLSDYPELFAGAAVVSGGPYGCTAACSNNPIVSDTYGTRDAPAPFLNDNGPPWDDPSRVIAAHPPVWNDAAAPKPRIIAYHGYRDLANVMPNTDDLASQWTQAVGVDLAPDNAALGLRDYFVAPSHEYAVYADAGGAIAMAVVKASDLGHGIMVDPGSGPYQGGHDEHPSKTACDPSADPSCVNDWTNTADFYEPYFSARFFGIVRE